MNASTNAHNSGVLLVGHGTRHPQGHDAFRRFAAAVAAAVAPRPLMVAFLELQEPMIEEELTRMVHWGVDQIIVAPVLLFAAGHAEKDIPTEVNRVLAGLPMQSAIGAPLNWFQAEHLGCHAGIIELSARRCQQAISGAQSLSTGKTCLLFVGRGSTSKSATAEMHEYARLVLQRLREQGLEIDEVRVAFLAMAEPSLPIALHRLAHEAAFQRIIVHPHLLFPGELLVQLESLVGEAAQRAPEIEWLIAPILSGHQGVEAGNPLLIAAMLDRINHAGENLLAGKPHLLFPLSPRD